MKSNRILTAMAALILVVGLTVTSYGKTGVLSDGQGTNQVYGPINLRGNDIFGGNFSGNGSGLTNITPDHLNLKQLISGSGIASFTYDGTTAATVTLASVDAATDQVNTGGSVVQTLQFDAWGRATNASSVDLDDRYYTKTSAEALFITNGQVNAITENMINDGAVTVNKIADGSITTNKIDSTLAAKYLEKAGGTMAGSIDMGTNTILNVSDPVNDKDAANKGYVDNLAAGISWKNPVETITNAPPGSPSNGERVLVGTDPSGDFAGKTNNIAVYNTNTSTWAFTAPSVADAVFTKDTESCYVYTTAGWIQFNGAANLVAGLGLNKDGVTLSIGASSSIDVGATNISVNTTWLDNHSQPKDQDLTTIAGMTTSGIVVRVSDTSWLTREVTGTAGEIDVSNGDGISGNPTIGLADVTIGGSGAGVEFDSKGRATNRYALTASDVTGKGILTNGSHIASLSYDTSSGATVAMENIGANGTFTKVYVDAFGVVTNGSATIDINSDTTGNYIESVAAGNAITITGSGTHSAAVTVAVTAGSIGIDELNTTETDARYITTNSTAQSKDGALTLNGGATIDTAVVLKPASSAVVSNTETIVVGSPIVRVSGDADLVGIQLPAGTADGQIIIIQGTDDAKRVVVSDSDSNVMLNSASFALGKGDTIQLMYCIAIKGGSDAWIELNRADL